MTKLDELFDPERLGPLWEREKKDGGPAAAVPAGPPPAPRSVVLLEAIASTIRRDLGPQVGPIEPLLERARLLLEERAARERDGKDPGAPDEILSLLDSVEDAFEALELSVHGVH